MLKTYTFENSHHGYRIFAKGERYPEARSIQELQDTQPERDRIDLRRNETRCLERIFNNGYYKEGQSHHDGAMFELQDLVRTAISSDGYDLDPTPGKVVKVYNHNGGQSKVCLEYDGDTSKEGLERVIEMEAYMADGREYLITRDQYFGTNDLEISMKLPDCNATYSLLWSPSETLLTVIPDREPTAADPANPDPAQGAPEQEYLLSRGLAS